MSQAKQPEDRIGVGSVRIREREKRYVAEVLESNRLSYGPFSRRLEAEFAAAHGCDHAILSNSGTSSLQVALAALREKHGWNDGDEILCPAASFVATSNVILQNGLQPAFVDIEADTYNMDPRRIRERIGDRTRGILVAHLYGQPAEMDPIVEIAAERGLPLVEDSAETMFARYRGRSVGAFGEIGCFSTYACHILVTGVGGIATTRDQETAALLRSLVNHGRDGIYFSMDDDRGKTGEDLREVMAGRFRFVRMGYSFRITEMEAALGVGQMETAEQDMAARRAIATRMLQELDGFREHLQLPDARPDRDHSYMMFPLVLADDAPFCREDLTLHLEECGIETRPMVTILNQPFYQQRYGSDFEHRFPVAERIARRGFYVGCHLEMTPAHVDRIVAAFADFFQRGG